MIEEVGKRVVVVSCVTPGSLNGVSVFLMKLVDMTVLEMKFADTSFLIGMEEVTMDGILKDLSSYEHLSYFSGNRPWHRESRGNFQYASEM